MAISKAEVTSLPGTAVPWGRRVESRLKKMEATVGIHTEAFDRLGSQVDKTVVAPYEYSMNFAPGIVGKQALSVPTSVQFVSGTGLFEVTISMAALSQSGAVIGFGFESNEFPYDLYFGLPKYGAVGASARADDIYVPVACSRSTVFSTRPGVYNFSLYCYVDTTITTLSQAYLHQGQISVKAV